MRWVEGLGGALSRALGSLLPDHPGEEGQIWVNGAGPSDLPANAAWDNAAGTGEVENTKLLARCCNNPINSRDPQMYPPAAPKALPSVPI